MASWLSTLFLCFALAAHAQTKSPEWALSEKLIDNVDRSAWVEESLRVSPDARRVAYGARDNEAFVVVDGKKQKQYYGIAMGTIAFSPDSKRVSYVAATTSKKFVVVDGKEGKQYDGILASSGVIFSPDGKRVAYGAQVGSEQFVVVDEREEKQYDGIGAGTLLLQPRQQTGGLRRAGGKQEIRGRGRERGEAI